MGLEVHIDEQNTHLSIQARGRYCLEDLRDLFDRLIKESDARGESRIILDLTEVGGFIPTMDTHSLGEHCSKIWKQTLRVAIISPAGGLDEFFQIVARNRGVPLAVVSSHAAAADWLE